jgi:hypothetical protein
MCGPVARQCGPLEVMEDHALNERWVARLYMIDVFSLPMCPLRTPKKNGRNASSQPEPLEAAQNMLPYRKEFAYLRVQRIELYTGLCPTTLCSCRMSVVPDGFSWRPSAM